MTVHHADLFHCLACGRVAYEPCGGPAPECCGQPMHRAVADLEVAAGTGSEFRGEVSEHALFAEALELSEWCHGLRDVDISRSEELANRLSVLQQALIDQVEDAQRGLAARVPGEGFATTSSAEASGGQGQELIALFTRFVAQLRNGPSPFGNWARVCDRMDELVSKFREYIGIEGTLRRPHATEDRLVR